MQKTTTKVTIAFLLAMGAATGVGCMSESQVKSIAQQTLAERDGDDLRKLKASLNLEDKDGGIPQRVRKTEELASAAKQTAVEASAAVRAITDNQKATVDEAVKKIEAGMKERGVDFANLEKLVGYIQNLSNDYASYVNKQEESLKRVFDVLNANIDEQESFLSERKAALDRYETEINNLVASQTKALSDTKALVAKVNDVQSKHVEKLRTIKNLASEQSERLPDPVGDLIKTSVTVKAPTSTEITQRVYDDLKKLVVKDLFTKDGKTALNDVVAKRFLDAPFESVEILLNYIRENGFEPTQGRDAERYKTAKIAADLLDQILLSKVPEATDPAIKLLGFAEDNDKYGEDKRRINANRFLAVCLRWNSQGYSSKNGFNASMREYYKSLKDTKDKLNAASDSSTPSNH